MPSGKQLSFQHGEVSPTQQYRSDQAMYATALSKLTNFYVLNEGGIANRPGLISLGAHAFQGDIPTVGGDPGITGKYVYDPIAKEYKLFEYYEADSDPAMYGIYLNGTQLPYGLGLSEFDVAPSKVRFVPLKTQLLFMPSMVFDNVGLDKVNPVYDFEDSALTAFGNKAHPAINNVTGSFFGSAPFLPVAYYVTATFDDGTERFVTSFQSAAIANPTTPPTTWVYPHADLQTTISVNLLGVTAGAKFYNFYRGAGRTNVFYKLAGRVKYDGSASAVLFNDFGADDPAQGPPEDQSLLGANDFGLGGMMTAMFYQQRLLGSYDTDIATAIKPGEIGASSIYAPDQLTMPLIFNNAGAFLFSVPITDNTPVVAQLAMERGIIMTEKGVYVLRGGTQGVLTPGTVNPGLVSEEGCSRVVEPKMKGRRGYFLNFDHTKLMAIEFGIDGNLVVYEISGLSEHFLMVDIHSMEVTGGKEDTLYMCRRDGKVVRVTMTGEAAGFSLLETDGFIENIFSQRLKRDYVEYIPQSDATPRLDPEYDALICYVIRNGVRYVERMAYREEELPQGFIYADAANTWGYRLSKRPSGVYKSVEGQLVSSLASPADGVRINLKLITNWVAGSQIKLTSTGNISELSTVGQRLHIFYTDENGNEKFIRFISQGSTTGSTAPFTFGWLGYFEVDVPTQLRDVEALNPTDKLAKETRWALAYNFFNCPAHLANKEVSVYMDGQVISSPNNPNMADQTITCGAAAAPVALPDYYTYGVVGLPYTNDLETMDIEAQDNRTLSDTHKLLNSVGVAFFQTLKGFFGMPNRTLAEMTERSEIPENETDMLNPPVTGQEIIPIPSEWTRPGRVRVVQVDALPMTIVALYPKGLAGE